MCGRFALGLSHDEIQRMHGYNVHVSEWAGRDQFVPRYNIAPRTQAPVIRRQEPGCSRFGVGSSNPPSSDSPTSGQSPLSHTASNETRIDGSQADDAAASAAGVAIVLQTMRWGLVPHYNKHDDSSLKTINARSEALVEEARGMWASIKGRKRCAVVCQGYYEWLKKGKERLPHFTKRKDGQLMLLAGLWDSVVFEGSTEPLWTFTIVTTDANREFSWLHDRQPVILPDEAALSLWLNTSSGAWTPQLSKLCEPYHAADHPLTCYQVPKEVGKIGTESPTFTQPVAERNDGIQALFAKQLHAKHSGPSQTDPHKRSTSPGARGDTDDIAAPRNKKPKLEKINAWEDDSDIEYIDNSSGSSTIRATEKPKPSPSLSPRSQTKATPFKKGNGKAKQSTSSNKITSFFSKK